MRFIRKSSSAPTSRISYTHDEAAGSWESYYTLDGLTSPSIHVYQIDRYTKYGCLVSDGYGNSQMVYFYVYVQNHFNAEAVNPVNTVGINDMVELKLKLSGDDLDGVKYRWYRYQQMGPNYFYYQQINSARSSSFLASTEYTKYRCIVTDRFGTPITVDFEVHIGESDGYRITVKDYTKGKATTDLDPNASYSGSKTFTVTSDQDKAVLVAVKNGSNYTVLDCITAGGKHSFTVNVNKDTDIVLVLKGDVNLDGKVALKDNLLLKKNIAGTETLDALPFLAGDVDGNGAIKLKDTLAVKKVIAGTSAFDW